MARAAAECAAADAMLGADHALVGLLRASQTAIEQILVVAAAQAAGAGLLLGGALHGLALLVVATALQLGFGLRLLILVESRHDICRELIIEGCAPRRLATVEREWRRLADPRHRSSLASSIELLAATAVRPCGALPGARPYFSVRLVRPLVPELREIAGLVRSDAPDVAGVALVERLLTSAGSPLHGADAQALRGELARARYRFLVAANPRVADRSVSGGDRDETRVPAP